MATSPDGEKILLGNHTDAAKILSLNGEAPVDLPGVVHISSGVAISADGRFAAAAGGAEDRATRLIRVWNLDSYEEVAAITVHADTSFCLRFMESGRLLAAGPAGLLSWDLETGTSETLFEGPVGWFANSANDEWALLPQFDNNSTLYTLGQVVLLDLRTGSTTPLTSHGNRVTTVAIDAGGTMAVTGDEDGVIRVGPITGEEPHLLLGNPGEIYAVAVDPLGRWIASSSGTEIRLWPMPDLSKPPLHTLPREELIAKLKTLTNLRVVRDPESSTGWKLTHDPFPGWETVPTW